MITFRGISKWPVNLAAVSVVVAAALLLTIPTKAQQSEVRPGESLARATVEDTRDPDKLGRIKVRFPTLPGEPSSWALVSLPIGARPGVFALPAAGDEVVVGFEHGDIQRPIVIGFLWNGDRPPASR
jgi:uncharacterized protein involved in type VI secretion and phage assembly